MCLFTMKKNPKLTTCRAMRDEQVSMANILMTPVPGEYSHGTVSTSRRVFFWSLSDRNELKSSLVRATPQQSARLQRYLKQRAARDVEPTNTPSVTRPVSHVTATQPSNSVNHSSVNHSSVNHSSLNNVVPAATSRLMEQSGRALDKVTVVGKSSAALDRVDRDVAEQQILMATRTPTRPKTARKSWCSRDAHPCTHPLHIS